MGLKIQATEPKVLLFDIETAPMLAQVWSLWDQNIGLTQLESDWYVLSFSAKWLNKEEITYKDQRHCKDMENDKQLMKHLWKLMDEADVIVGHNLDKFDVKKVNTRFLLHGMRPPSDYRTIDTLKIARSKFAFSSNKLEHLAEKLEVKYKKLKHKDFPGHLLWKECLKRNFKAWEEMEEYNKMDVLVLQEIYWKLDPWHKKVNFNVFHQGQQCSCGGNTLNKWGFKFTNSGKFQRYKCRSCGKDFVSKENLVDIEIRKGLLK